jgi:uncharacterized protein with FMN-binding domain
MNLNAGKAHRARLGLASLLSAVVVVVLGKAATGHAERAGAVSMPGAATGTAQPATGDGSGPSTATTAAPAPAPGPASGSRSASGTTGSSGTRTVVGDAEDTRYGPVQVELVVTNGTISDVVALQLPDRERRDVEIDGQAVPILRQEVLSAQSAKIDAVSGASYTSSGYAWSVQSAIDKAGLHR